MQTKKSYVVLALLWTGVCLLLSCSGLPGGMSQKPGSATHTRTSASGCPAPNSPGVVVCQPDIFTSTDSPVQVNASATASSGRVIQMQVLADGQKIAQTPGNQFDAPITLSPGTHTLTVMARETGGSSLTSAPISAEIVGSSAGEVCPPPSSPGVNVCSPTPPAGANGHVCAVNTFMTFLASGTPETGIVKEMQLLVDGVDVANFPGNSLNTNFVSDAFNFTVMTIVEVDSKGQKMSSPAFTFDGPC